MDSWAGFSTWALAIVLVESGNNGFDELVDITGSQRQDDVARRPCLYHRFHSSLPASHLRRLRVAGGELSRQLISNKLGGHALDGCFSSTVDFQYSNRRRERECCGKFLCKVAGP